MKNKITISGLILYLLFVPINNVVAKKLSDIPIINSYTNFPIREWKPGRGECWVTRTWGTFMTGLDTYGTKGTVRGKTLKQWE